MARDYWFAFGSGNPGSYPSLSPTFITFRTASGVFTPPGITETPAGSGLYWVNYGATATIVFTMDGATTGLAASDRYIFGVFDPQDEFGNTLLAIGATVGQIGQNVNALGSSQLALGATLVGLGNTSVALGVTANALGTSLVASSITLVALGTSIYAQGLSTTAVGATLLTLVGGPASSFGTNLSDPSTMFGFLKRAQEVSEGNEVYTKATGVLDSYSRGSSQLLIQKTISDDNTETTKT